MDRGKGYKMWDIDGNEYVDYLMCGAPIMLGHAYDPLDDKIIDIIKKKGPATGLTSEYELLAAEEIVKNMPAVDMVRFLQSGTEADMAALRIARAYTGKKKGHQDRGELPRLVGPDGITCTFPGPAPSTRRGITPESYAHLIE